MGWRRRDDAPDGTADAAGGHLDAGDVQRAVYNARADDADILRPARVLRHRELRPAAPHRSRRHGVPAGQRYRVLAPAAGTHYGPDGTHDPGPRPGSESGAPGERYPVFPHDARSEHRLDTVRTTVRATAQSADRPAVARVAPERHRHDGRCYQLHHHNRLRTWRGRHLGEPRHLLVEHARHERDCTVRVPAAGERARDAPARPEPRDDVLCDGRRWCYPLATPVLVLGPPGGVHPLPPGDG